MHSIVNRCAALLAATVLVLSGCTSGSEPAGGSSSAEGSEATTTELTAAIGRLEAEYGAVVGLYAVDTGTGAEVTHRADRRFAFASTYKALAAGAVLARSGPDELSRVVTYDDADLVPYSPITEQHVADGMPMSAIIDAAVQESDNTAGNLLFDALGGPAGFQDALRSIGDETTRSERREPELNDVAPGDERDTSTPRALATDLRAYAVGDGRDDVAGDLLDDDARATFVETLRGSTTGMDTIRAGVPDGWVVGDKTGTSGHGTRNDIGVVWPPDGDPIVLAVLTHATAGDEEPDDALLAEATRVAIEALRN